MRHSRQVAAVMDMLRMDLEGWTIPRATKTITFTPPSLLTDESYAGVPLRYLMLPSGPARLGPVATAFERLVSGGGGGLGLGLGPGVTSFVGQNPARLLLWASTRRDADLDMDLDEGRMMVIGEETFGFADGKAYVPSGALDYEVDLVKLFEPEPYSTREVGFAALWKRAKRLNRHDARVALEAIRAYKPTPWRSIASWTWTKNVDTDLSMLGEIIYTSSDPIGEIYTHLVPNILSRKEFSNKIAPLEGRPLDPNSEARVKLWRQVAKLMK